MKPKSPKELSSLLAVRADAYKTAEERAAFAEGAMMALEGIWRESVRLEGNSLDALSAARRILWESMGRKEDGE